MFTETDGSRKAIGDVDIVYHDGLYHLFHLVLPNHDFIAHAISTNAINWRRVNNALFIGDPGSWDDLMLWTMHVSPDPHQPGRWRMFYTGLSRREQGRMQRIGLAVSDDLFHWRKAPVNWRDTRGRQDPEPIARARAAIGLTAPTRIHAPLDPHSCFPLQACDSHYESRIDEGRHWVSFRDPFYFRDEDQGWLLAAGRVKHGPVIRRGCVSVLQETAPNQFESLPPLHHPGIYDDIEVPNLMAVGERYYLIGSIREDAKIRYWHADKQEHLHADHRWHSTHDNVLLAQGNYAGRISRDDRGWLIWNFYSMDRHDRTRQNVMPPPKRLVPGDDGLLRVVTFEEYDQWLDRPLNWHCLRPLKAGVGPEVCRSTDQRLELQNETGFQAFVFEEPVNCFRFQGRLRTTGLGKCGLIFRIDPDTHDGYYLSLDLLKGIAQLRRWQTGPEGSGAEMMQFESLQSAYWYSRTPGAATFQLLAFGSYMELSIDGYVVLSLVDQTFREGLLGIYLETTRLAVSELDVHHLKSPYQSDEHLVVG